MRSTPYNLVMSAMFKGLKGWRPPAVNPTAIVCHGLMDACGVSYPEAHLVPEAMAELALAGHTVAGFDSVMPEYSVDQEAAALGCEMDWGDRNTMPDAKSFPHADFSDIEIPSDFLEKPSMRVVLDALSILRKKIGGRVAIIGKAMGPWTLSYHMVGTQNFLLQVGMGETAKIEKMLRQLVPASIASVNAQFAAGADIVVLADHATGNLVSAKHYRDLLLQIHKDMMAEIQGPIILHVCGNCRDRLDLFAEAGFDCYHFEYQTDPRVVVETVGRQMSLAGCINNPQTLYQGSPEDVYAQTREVIAAGVDMIGPECCIPLATPLENLKAIVAACREGY
jgi:MtaA/CmuA family methyltransferase